MKYTTFLILTMLQFIITIPVSFYLMTIGFTGLFFSLTMISSLLLIITLYYPLITINN